MKKIYMHEMIMEKLIDRELAPGEWVRHKNGNTLDNQLENLGLVNEYVGEYAVREEDNELV